MAKRAQKADATEGRIDLTQLVTAEQKLKEAAQSRRDARAAAYRQESDPLLFDLLAEVFGDDPRAAAWLKARATVKAG